MSSAPEAKPVLAQPMPLAQRLQCLEMSDLLRVRTERAGLPEAFYAHHGNLSREHREFVEARLKDDQRPATAICTSTLELGIDIGAIDAIAQIGAPFTVSSLRQRLGRSGRRSGKPATLRIYVDEPRPDARSSFNDRLNLRLVQCVAMLELLIDRWCEPPVLSGLHLSTLTHQILSVVCERGGARPPMLYDLLCRQGPFRSVSTAVFADVLRALALPHTAMIEQSEDGLILLGASGERLADRYEFYAVFSTPDEYRVAHGPREIGRVSMEYPRSAGDLILLAGRRWRIETIDDPAKTIFVAPSAGALPPGFSGNIGGVHDVVAKRMRDVLIDASSPPYLDAAAAEMLAEARKTYGQIQAGPTDWIIDSGKLLLFPWVGHRKLRTLAAALRARGVDAGVEDCALQLDAGSLVDAREAAASLIRNAPSAVAIARALQPKITKKFHPLLTDELLTLEAAAASIDLENFEFLVGGLSNAIDEVVSSQALGTND
jgi:ATP-dependent helicase Lhr and Lhr-like helicase